MQASNPSNTVSRDTIERIGHDARNEHAILGDLNLAGKNVRGACIDITNYIVDELVDTHDLPEDSVVKYRCNVGEAQELHYAAAVHTNHVGWDTEETGFLIIDATIDQFCAEQRAIRRVETSFGSYDSLPRVAVLPPGDARRQQWYHDPTGEHDPTTEYRPTTA